MSHGSAFPCGRHVHSARRYSGSIRMAGAPGRCARRPWDSRESAVGMPDVPVRRGTRNVRDALPFAQLVLRFWKTFRIPWFCCTPAGFPVILTSKGDRMPLHRVKVAPGRKPTLPNRTAARDKNFIALTDKVFGVLEAFSQNPKEPI